MKTLIIDNYDSFTYNLAQLIGSIGSEIHVYRNDQISIDKVQELRPDRIVISPGPGNPKRPRDFGVCFNILREISTNIPTLGVCLGHQGMIYAFGGKITRANNIMHGKVSMIKHDGKGIYRGVESPFSATRYHSLVGQKESIPMSLKVTATAMDDGEIMGIRHIEYPIEGVQFHPESILTPSGSRIIQNFLGEEYR